MEGFKYYHFEPNFGAAVFFALAFGVPSILHIRLIAIHRAFYFIPFLIGCLLECIGYGVRSYSSKQTPDWTLMPYLIQNLFILLGPAFYAASIYMVLGRLIRSLEAERHSLIRVNWLTKIFLLGDILSILSQAGGGGILAQAKSESSQNLGNSVILIGLGIQVVFFGCFMIVTAVFHLRILKTPTPKSIYTLTPWKMFIMVLYFTSLLIMVRSVFRMIEYAQGHDGDLIKQEAFVYVLDALLMVIVAAAFVWYHPHKVLVEHQKLESGHDLNDDSDAYPMSRDGLHPV